MLGSPTPASGIVAILKEDHVKIKDLFIQFASAPFESRGPLALDAIHRLRLHADLKKKVLYPAIRRVIDPPGLVEQAMKEHRRATKVMRELMRLRPNDDTFRVMFCALGEQIQRYITIEEEELLPQVERSALDCYMLQAQWLGQAHALEDQRSRSSLKASRIQADILKRITTG